MKSHNEYVQNFIMYSCTETAFQNTIYGDNDFLPSDLCDWDRQLLTMLEEY